MTNKLRTIPFFSHTARVLLALTALQFPAVGYCDSGNGLVNSLFGSKGKNMKEVAIKVAELPEQYKINVHGLDFSPDGKQLAIVSDGEKINIWDWRSGRIVHTVEKTQGANDGLTTEPIRYSPDGRLFVSCSNIVTRIWNTETWTIVHDITNPIGSCNAIGFTPDGNSLLVIDGMGSGNNLIVYDTTTWQPVWGLRTVTFYTKALAISPDGKRVAIGGGYIIGLPQNGQPMTSKPLFGDQLVSNESAIIVVDLAQRKIVGTMQNTVDFDFGRLAWSPDGTHIAAMGRRGWDGSANDGQGTYTSGLDNVMVFDAHSGKQIAGEQLEHRKQIANEQLEDVGRTTLRYTPDKKYLIEGINRGLERGEVRIWDGQHRELLQEIPSEVSGLAVSRDGHYFAMGEVGKTTVWQLK